MKIFFILDLWKWIRKQHRFFSVKELSWFVWMFQRAPNSESTMPAGLWGLSLRVLKWSPQEFTSYTTGTAQFVSVYKNVFVYIPFLLRQFLVSKITTGCPPLLKKYASLVCTLYVLITWVIIVQDSSFFMEQAFLA